MEKIRGFWPFVLLLVFGLRGYAAPLNGTYTIDANGSGSTNFVSWNGAVNALHTDGISGPVVFKVADGIYVEQVKIGLIAGVSPSNRIRFESASGDSTKAILSFPTTVYTKDTLNYAIKLYNARFIQFHQLGFRRTGTGRCKNVIHIDSLSRHISFTNNFIHGANNSITNIQPAYVISTEGWGNLDTIVVENNVIRSGYASIGFAYGLSNKHTQYVKVSGNHIDSAYSSTIEVVWSEDVYITDNVVLNNRGWCIFTSSNIGDIQVERNFIRKTGTTWGTGILMEDWSPHYFSDARVTNNIIDLEGGASTNGILISVRVGSNSYNRDILVAHNSIRLSTSDATNVGIRFNVEQTSPYSILNNNIIVNQGVCIHFNASNVFTNLVKACNYNNFYTTGSNVAQFQTSKYKTLVDWRKTQLALDMNSVAVDPEFTSSPFLFPSANAFDNKGVQTSVTTDYFGFTRNTIPDIGAVEFEPKYMDAGIKTIGSRNLSICDGETVDIKAKIFNLSSDTLTNLVVGWALAQNPQTPLSWSGTIAPSDSLEVLLGNYYVVGGSSVNITMFVASPNGLSDSITSNDSTSFHVLGLNKPDASFTYTISGTIVNFLPIDSLVTSSYWDFGDGDSSNGLKPSHDFKKAGKYTVTHRVQNSDGCLDTSVKEVDVIINGLVNSGKKEFKVFPNPFQHDINLVIEELPLTHAQVEVFDIQGRLIYRVQGQIKDLTSVNLSSLMPGTYRVKLITPNDSYFVNLIKIP